MSSSPKIIARDDDARAAAALPEWKSAFHPLMPSAQDPQPPDPYRGPAPVVACVFEIDISVGAGGVTIAFSKAWKIDVPDQAAFDQLCRDIAAGVEFPNPHVNPLPGPGTRPPSPLSVSNDGLVYIIFRLAPVNCYFARTHAPISLSRDAYGARRHFEGQGILPDGTTAYGSGIGDDCKAAYLISDGSGVPDYKDDFNLHIEVVSRDRLGAKMYMPITVDPDIRFPGGTTP